MEVPGGGQAWRRAERENYVQGGVDKRVGKGGRGGERICTGRGEGKGGDMCRGGEGRGKGEGGRGGESICAEKRGRIKDM